MRVLSFITLVIALVAVPMAAGLCGACVGSSCDTGQETASIAVPATPAPALPPCHAAEPEPEAVPEPLESRPCHGEDAADAACCSLLSVAELEAPIESPVQRAADSVHLVEASAQDRVDLDSERAAFRPLEPDARSRSSGAELLTLYGVFLI